MDVVKSFNQESKQKKIILASAFVSFASSFLPWFSFSFGGFGGVSVNGWHRFGLITALASLALILNWLLPLLKIKVPLKIKEDLLQKILAGAMLGGIILWLIDSSFELSVMGVGFYLSLAASIVAAYTVFKMKAAVKKV